MTARIQQTQGNYNKNVYCVYQFAFIWCFFIIAASIVLRQLVSRVKLNRVLYLELF